MKPVCAATYSCFYNFIKWLIKNKYTHEYIDSDYKDVFIYIKGYKLHIGFRPEYVTKTVTMCCALTAKNPCLDYEYNKSIYYVNHINHLKNMIINFDPNNLNKYLYLANKYEKLDANIRKLKSDFI